jgi:hypothetical protein
VTDTPQGEGGRLAIVLIVARSAGRLRILPPKTFQGGREWLEKGQPVAEIEHGPGREPDEVRAPCRGLMGGLMGRDGEPIREGQPVAWMEGVPEDSSVVKPVKDTA